MDLWCKLSFNKKLLILIVRLFDKFWAFFSFGILL